MRVVVVTPTDRYIFPEAESIEIEKCPLFMEADPDLPGTVIREAREGDDLHD